MKATTLSFEETARQQIHMEHSVTNGFSMPYMHTHVEYELLYIRSGNIRVDNNTHSISAKAPCVIVHRPFMLHRANTEDDDRYDRFIINFGTDFVNRFSHWIPDFDRILQSSMSVIELDPALNMLMSSGIGELWQTYKEQNYRRAELELALLLNRFTGCVDEGRVRAVRDEQSYISDVMDYISHHIDESLQTEELARRFFVSRAKFTSDFKARTSVTVKQYIILTRVNYAKQLMLSGSSVSEAARLCGFCDDSHFINTFRSVVGQTPRAFLAGCAGPING